MKKIFLLITFLSLFVYAEKTDKKVQKYGCLLSQKGKVTVNWAEYGNDKYAVQGEGKDVKYTAIKKEGNVFKEILVGSTIESTFKDKKLLAKITHIQSKKRIGRGPRHGVVVLNITLNEISKDIPMVYFYENGDLKIKSVINLNDFKLSSEIKYSELSFGIHIYSVVCAV